MNFEGLTEEKEKKGKKEKRKKRRGKREEEREIGVKKREITIILFPC